MPRTYVPETDTRFWYQKTGTRIWKVCHAVQFGKLNNSVGKVKFVHIITRNEN